MAPLDGNGRAHAFVERAAGLPKWLVFLLLLALVLLALFLDGWLSLLAHVGVAAVLATLASVSWPALSSPGRLARVAVIAVVVAHGVVRWLA